MPDPRTSAYTSLFKEWLPKLTDPDYLMSTRPAQAMVMGMLASNPGIAVTLPLLGAAADTKIGKSILGAMDAIPPSADFGIHDIAIKGLRQASHILPESMAVVAPLVSKLGLMKPRGIPAASHEYFHSNLAEAIDREFIAPGHPEDLLSIKQVKAWLNKLPGMGVKKEEIKHFNLANDITDLGDPNATGKISRDDLAYLIDRKMPKIEVGEGRSYEKAGQPARYAEYTLPEGANYRNHVLNSPDQSISHLENENFDTLNSPFTDPIDRGHWDEPNVLQHLRTKDRILPDGRKALYVEESQSDWAQQSPESYPLSLNYEDLANKYLYRYAADNGYDAIASTPGSVHIQRWHGEKRPEVTLPKYQDYADLPIDHPLRNELSVKMEDLRKEYFNKRQGQPPNKRLDINLEEEQAKQDLKNKYNQMVRELETVTKPAVDTRFSGFETFYNKRFPDSAKGMMKRMGVPDAVKETPLQPVEFTGGNPDPNGPLHYSMDPIESIKHLYRRDNPPSKGWVQPAPHQSFVWNVRPEDKKPPPPAKVFDYSDEDLKKYMDEYNKPWSNMTGKTTPLWMLLGGIGLNALRGTSTNSPKPE